jgi:hypothetical protein
VFVSFSSRPSPFAYFSSTNAWLEIVSRGNPGYAAYLRGDSHSELNATTRRLEWTNGPRLSSTMVSLVNLTTNSLK